MYTETIHRIFAAGTDFGAHILSRAPVFDMATTDSAGKQAKLICSKEVFINVELQIPHGSALKLTNLKWLVAYQQAREPLLGRPVVDALGLNTRGLLAMAADRFDGSIDAKRLVGWVYGHSAGRVSCSMERVFHVDEGENVEYIDTDSEEWYDIGYESNTE